MCICICKVYMQKISKDNVTFIRGREERHKLVPWNLNYINLSPLRSHLSPPPGEKLRRGHTLTQNFDKRFNELEKKKKAISWKAGPLRNQSVTQSLGVRVRDLSCSLHPEPLSVLCASSGVRTSL